MTGFMLMLWIILLLMWDALGPSNLPPSCGKSGRLGISFSMKRCLLIAMELLLKLAGFWKLNTDGSAEGNPGKAGFGGIIRNDSGQWRKGYFGKIGICSSLMAELWAIREGLKLLMEDHASHVIVESDCATAVNLLQDINTGTSVYAALLEDCKFYASRIANCSFAHTLREGNFCADVLANKGRIQESRMTILEVPPKDLEPMLLADMASVAFVRPPR
uniref:Putative LINE-type retrotransposon LIb DNA n=1 Tax=Davidia involucrata TaxID=16924 RepID=A0A5B7A378_DAVIN